MPGRECDVVITVFGGVEIDTSGYELYWDMEEGVALLKDGTFHIVWLPDCSANDGTTWTGPSISIVEATPEVIACLDNEEDPDDWPATDVFGKPIGPGWGTPCGFGLEPLPFCVEAGDKNGRLRVIPCATLDEANGKAEELWSAIGDREGAYIVAGLYAWSHELEGRAAAEVPHGFRQGRRTLLPPQPGKSYLE